MWGRTCNACHQKNHFAIMYPKNRDKKIVNLVGDNPTDSSGEHLLTVKRTRLTGNQWKTPSESKRQKSRLIPANSSQTWNTHKLVSTRLWSNSQRASREPLQDLLQWPRLKRTEEEVEYSVSHVQQDWDPNNREKNTHCHKSIQKPRTTIAWSSRL